MDDEEMEKGIRRERRFERKGEIGRGTLRGGREGERAWSLW